MRNYALIIILGATLIACSESQSPNETKKMEPPAVPVIIEEVAVRDVPIYFESIGTLKSDLWVELKPQVSGMLEKTHFIEGQNVVKGMPLFSIDSTSYTIKLQEARAQLAQDTASLEVSKKKLDRHKNLATKDLISKQDWDEMQAQVAKNEAQVKADKAKVAAVQLDLQRCTIKAPIDGKIGKMMIHPGNLVSANQSSPLATISNMENLTIDFTLTEREYLQLTEEHRQGDYPIQICPFSSQDTISEASLKSLDNVFDAQTGLLHIQGRFSNEKQQFFPGQHLRVKIPSRIITDAQVISQKAVKINQEGPFVYVVKDDTSVEIRQLTLGEEVNENVIVLKGLKPNEKIVTEGHLRLSPGTKVEYKLEPGDAS